MLFSRFLSFSIRSQRPIEPKSMGRGGGGTRPGLFTILEFQNQEIVKFYVVQKHRATDFEAPKL